MRRVDLERPVGDRAVGRGIDGVAAVSIFHQGRSGSRESKRAQRRAYEEGDVMVPEGQLFKLPLEDELDALAARGPRSSYRFEGLTVARLADALKDAMHGCWPEDHLVAAALQGTLSMVAKATHERAHTPSLHLITPREARVKKGGETRVAATFLARIRTQHMQRCSDPDLVRLRVIHNAIEEQVSLTELLKHSELMRFCIGEQPNGRGNLPRIIRSDSVSWRDGLAIAWQKIRMYDQARVKAWQVLRSSVASKLSSAEVLALVSLLDPTVAQRLQATSEMAPLGRIQRMLRPPRSFAHADESDLLYLTRVYGWLDAGIDEPTKTERALRNLRQNGIDTESLIDFAERGDTSVFLAHMNDPVSSTRYTLQVKSLDSTLATTTSLARTALASLTDRPITTRQSFNEAVFHRYPKRIVREATKLSANEIEVPEPTWNNAVAARSEQTQLPFTLDLGME